MQSSQVKIPSYSVTEGSLRHIINSSIRPHQYDDYLEEVSLFYIPNGTNFYDDKWILKLDLAIKIIRENSNFVAIYQYLDEYGIGNTKEESVDDLLKSLVDYRNSLEKRESRLSDIEKDNLDTLRVLINKK